LIRNNKKRERTRNKNDRTIERQLRKISNDSKITPNILKERNFQIFANIEKKFNFNKDRERIVFSRGKQLI